MTENTIIKSKDKIVELPFQGKRCCRNKTESENKTEDKRKILVEKEIGRAHV